MRAGEPARAPRIAALCGENVVRGAAPPSASPTADAPPRTRRAAADAASGRGGRVGDPARGRGIAAVPAPAEHA